LDDPTIGKTVKSDLSRQLWKRFAENGIEIPFPQRDIHIRSHVNSGLSSANDKD
jgi:small-conductance mechanosensitive channel